MKRKRTRTRPPQWWISESNPSKSAKLRLALSKLLQEHEAADLLPTSGRFLYYELEHLRPDLVKKGGEGRSDQPVTVALTQLREVGLIQWPHIEDETRELKTWAVWPSIEEAMRETWKTARVSLWYPQRPPLILCESRSLMGVLEPLAWEFHCPITSTNGQCVGFLHTRLAPALAPGDRILLFGDLDKGGEDIESNDRKVLNKLVPGLVWERVAIKPEHVDTYGLTYIKKRDGREGKVRESVETEALGQARIIALLRARLEELMPEKRRKRVLSREAREREEARRKYGFEK